MRSSRTIAAFALLVATSGVAACANDFDTSRSVPKRGSVGRELYGLVCDRVGAQALREDVLATSYHAVCHAAADGSYADTVDTAKLPPLHDGAPDVDGHPTPLDVQQQHRAHRVARIEALAHRREDLVAAFDAMLPDAPLAVRDPATCAAAPDDGRLLDELAATLSRFVDLYDDRTIPQVTEGLARVMENVDASPDAQAALARLGARQGYRPASIALGVARPVFAYPRFPELADAVLRVLSERGSGAPAFEDLLAASHEELRTAVDPAPLAPLVATTDSTASPPRVVLSRPRTNLEVTRQILLAADDAYAAAGAPPLLVTARDRRGVAAVPLVEGALPAPFVDKQGDLPGSPPDGLPDVDGLGRFVSSSGPVPSPFFSSDEGSVDGPRDASGRALAKAGAQPLFGYFDANRTYASSLVRSFLPLVDPDPAHGHEALLDVVAGLPVVLGPRDSSPSTTRAYPPDVKLAYRGVKVDASPLVDLVYAIGQIVASPETDDALALAEKLATDHPQELARLVGAGFAIKKIADAHPEAHIPANSTLWDELLDTFATLAEKPGVYEDLIRAFDKDATVNLATPFAAYFDFKDDLSYDRNAVNGPAFDVTTSSVGLPHVKVDRSQPDTGANRSEFQRFAQILHETNGLAACTKRGAIAHIVWKGVGIDYPTDPAAKTACLFLTGDVPPDPEPECGILRIPNVASMLLDVALDRAQFDVRDNCLKQLMASPLTGIVGGPDVFLETVSGVKGFSTHPTVNGISRFVFFDTPHDGLPGDTKNLATRDFFKDLVDPIPSTVCPLAPFTDTDGTVLNLHSCASFKDTLRGRLNDATFPLEDYAFVPSVKPLAAAFADHGAALDFVTLFDTLHAHWGSDKQSVDECDPSAARSSPKWCSRDGAVTYEPLLAEALRSDLFPALRAVVPVLEQMQITHCDAADPKTGACTKKSARDGVTVLAEALRQLVDPKRNAGLADRHGVTIGRRNDGATNPQTTPIYLLVDALKAFDDAFAKWPSTHPGDDGRLAKWRAARSLLTDTFFQVDGTGTGAQFHDPSVPKILPVAIEALRAQRAAHCPDPSQPCAWAKTELTANIADSVGGPTLPAVVDVLDAVRKDDVARTELEKLLTWLLDGKSPEEAQATVTTALVDLLQVLSDDTNLAPLYRALSGATGRKRVDPASGAVMERSLTDAAVQALARIFATVGDGQGHEACGKEIDPNHAVQIVLQKLVTPMGDKKPAPIEVLVDVVTDVNRAHPEDAPQKLAPEDYANIASEIDDFCMNKSRGLEQVYEVIRQVTVP